MANRIWFWSMGEVEVKNKTICVAQNALAGPIFLQLRGEVTEIPECIDGDFLKDVKDADKVGLLILYTAFLFWTGNLRIFVSSFMLALPKTTVDRAISSVKDFFAVGTALITAAWSAPISIKK